MSTKKSILRTNGHKHEDRILQLAVGSIVKMNPYQPRDKIEADDELREMAKTIERRGRLVQPIIVRLLSGRDRYQLVAGERRLEAVKLAGLPQVSAIVRELSDQAMLEEALIENLYRKDLTPPEEGRAVQMAIDQGIALEDLAERTGKSEQHLRLHLRIFKELAADVQKKLRAGELKTAHAEVLLDLESKRDQSEGAKMAVDQNLTAIQLRARTQHKRGPARSHNVTQRGYGHQQLSKDILCLHANLQALQIDPELPDQRRQTLSKQIGVLIKALEKAQSSIVGRKRAAK